MKLILFFQKLTKKILHKTLWQVDRTVWLFLFMLYKKKYKNKVTEMPVTIGIATFMDRYESCLVPLLKKLTYLFPNTEIIVVANGHVKQKKQTIYLSTIQTFCDKFTKVRLFTHQRPKGLSAIWNQIIKNATNDQILILNDDVDIKTSFCKFLSNALNQNLKFFTINTSWSHFMISKQIFNIVDDFDEGFLEIGGEDDDYAARMAMRGIEIKNFNSSGITGKLQVKSKHKKLTVNSYGRNMYKESQGYSSYNSQYLIDKWLTNNEPFEGAFEVPSRKPRYWKIRE